MSYLLRHRRRRRPLRRVASGRVSLPKNFHMCTSLLSLPLSLLGKKTVSPVKSCCERCWGRQKEQREEEEESGHARHRKYPRRKEAKKTRGKMEIQIQETLASHVENGTRIRLRDKHFRWGTSFKRDSAFVLSLRPTRYKLPKSVLPIVFRERVLDRKFENVFECQINLTF